MKPSLAPKLAASAHPSYLEPLCPFSYKMAKSLEANVLPHVKEGGKYHGKLQLIVRIYAQPL